MDLTRVLWTAVLATVFAFAGVGAALFGADSSVSLSLGLTGITFAILNLRADK